MYKPKTQKRIQNLSRAINKLDSRLLNKLGSYQFRIEDVEAGINSIKYLQNGVRMEIRYTELENLGEKEQSSLIQKLSIDRYQLRQERAYEQLQTKGKISWQFKRSLEKDHKSLVKQIEQIESRIEGNSPKNVMQLFEDEKPLEDWEDDADAYFNDPDIGTPELFDFYYTYGFEEKNYLTWNTYKVIKNIDVGDYVSWNS